MAFEYAPIIAKYGYIATFAGSLIEGETVQILSGLAAHRGYLDFAWVVLVGALGGALGDVGYFMLGRHYRVRLVQSYPKLRPGIERVRGMIERHPDVTIFTIRFLYGLRTVGPIAIGSTHVPLSRFLLVNALGALAWSLCWAGAGYLIGQSAKRMFGELARYEGYVFLGVIVVGAIVAIVLRLRRHTAS
ncbi:MAG: DedA family protein [Betaproteobacteria bacterium]